MHIFFFLAFFSRTHLSKTILDVAHIAAFGENKFSSAAELCEGIIPLPGMSTVWSYVSNRNYARGGLSRFQWKLICHSDMLTGLTTPIADTKESLEGGVEFFTFHQNQRYG